MPERQRRGRTSAFDATGRKGPGDTSRQRNGSSGDPRSPSVDGSAKEIYASLIAASDEWIEHNTRLADAKLKSSQAAFTSSKSLLIALLALATMTGLAIAFFIARGITRGVGQMLVASRGIAAGDVDQAVSVYSNDELGESASAFRAMIAYLKRMAAAAETIAEGDLRCGSKREGLHGMPIDQGNRIGCK